MELVLYRQYAKGLFKVYRHSGQVNGKWRPVFTSTDEGAAMKTYDSLLKKLKQGGLRLFDPEGQMLQNVYYPPMRWDLSGKI